MKFGILGNLTKPALREVSSVLLSFLKRKKISYILDTELGVYLNSKSKGNLVSKKEVCPEVDLPKKCDILIALGGDGTMLAAARLVGSAGTPILGVNLGKLGFLAEVSVDELEHVISDILKKKYTVQDRQVLEATAKKDGAKYYALNEIVVDKGASARVINLETYVNNDYLVTYSADGIIVNTPTGSTAYSLATGGPIVAPESNVLTINPIAPHTLTARPLIIPEGSIVRIVADSGGKSVHITADGQVEGFYDTPAEFVVRKAPYTIKLVKIMKRTFYDLLRTKLLWGRDVRTGGRK